MCGPSRPSSGGLIAVLFTSQSTSYSIRFHNPETAEATKAFIQTDSLDDLGSIDLRIEKHGDLTTLDTDPLHTFRLQPRLKGPELECSLPERLDLGISDRGIVGRRITVAGGRGGTGIVGYN